MVGTQRVLLAVGVLGLGIGRELDASPVFLGVAGAGVIASLVICRCVGAYPYLGQDRTITPRHRRAISWR